HIAFDGERHFLLTNLAFFRGDLKRAAAASALRRDDSHAEQLHRPVSVGELLLVVDGEGFTRRIEAQSVTAGALDDGAGVGAHDRHGGDFGRPFSELQRHEDGEEDAENGDEEADVFAQSGTYRANNARLGDVGPARRPAPTRWPDGPRTPVM